MPHGSNVTRSPVVGASRALRRRHHLSLHRSAEQHDETERDEDDARRRQPEDLPPMASSQPLLSARFCFEPLPPALVV